jgi:hypothetical protein
MKKHGAIAFLDMLGTKSKWREDVATDFLNNIELLYKELDGMHASIKKLETIETVKNFEFYKILQNFENKQKEFKQKSVPSDDGNKLSLADFFSKFLRIEISTFSDTIIIALYPDVDLKVFDSLLLHIMGHILIFLFRSALLKKIYLRGTISVGTFYLLRKDTNKLMLIGPAVNEAAESYESTNWVGISTSPSASLTLEQDTRIFDDYSSFKSTIDNLEKENRERINQLRPEQRKVLDLMYTYAELLEEWKKIYIQYDIPNKNGIENDGWALAWPLIQNDDSETIFNILNHELDFTKYQNRTVGYDVYLKRRNTRRFYSFCSNKSTKINLAAIMSRLIFDV